jgi:cytosine deaminase
MGAGVLNVGTKIAMELIKVKTARFSAVVAACGRPQVFTLWVDPKNDPTFRKALKSCRVMSVHQTVVGSKKDFAEVGYVRAAQIALLIFPKSLAAFADRRIVGIDYNLVERPSPSAKDRKASPAKREKTTPRPPAPPRNRPRDPVVPKPASKAVPKAPVPTRRNRKAPAKPMPEPVLDPFMIAAINEARKGLAEGGIPIGSSLVKDGKLVAVGHNKRVQDDDPVTHAETDCLRNAGRLGSYRGCTLYSTLMPCYFCAGAAVQFGIKKVVVGESRTFPGAPEFMRQHGIEVIDLDLPECYEMMEKFIREHPKLWNEDIGVD